MSYSSFSVVFGEQPSAAKWNILGTNDASFNDGSGIADSKILPRHLLTGTGSTNWVWGSGTPNGTGFSAKTVDTLRYIQVGKIVFCQVDIEGTSNATTLTFTLPVAAKAADTIASARIANSGAFLTTAGLIQTAAASTTATVSKDTSGAAFTNTGTKVVAGYFFYEAN